MHIFSRLVDFMCEKQNARVCQAVEKLVCKVHFYESLTKIATFASNVASSKVFEKVCSLFNIFNS